MCRTVADGGEGGGGGPVHALELRDRLLAVVEPVVGDAGLDLETVTVQPAGRRRIIRVVVDRDGGVTSDQLAEASQLVSRALDDADPMGPGAYTLEVTTPGLDRPLTEPRHWRRASKRLVRAPLTSKGGGPEGQDTGGEVRGRVVTADDQGVVLDQDGEEHRYSYDDLGNGKIEVEFRRHDAGPADAADAAADEGDPGEDVQ